MEYYTYAYLREDKTPYYIGKGKGKRLYQKDKWHNPPKDKSRIIFLKENLTEEEAFRHEIYMINVFGRKDLGNGILYNKTDGGDGASGCIRSEESKRKISEANKGKILSKETKRKISDASKNISEKTRIKLSVALKGKNLGKIRSNETRKKISDALKKRIITDETRKKRSENFKGEKNPSKNAEVIEKRRQKMTGKSLPPEHCENIGKSKKGVKWWNNGKETKFCIECPGEEWSMGRIITWQMNKKML
jgi:hypothetical protein